LILGKGIIGKELHLSMGELAHRGHFGHGAKNKIGFDPCGTRAVVRRSDGTEYQTAQIADRMLSD